MLPSIILLGVHGVDVQYVSNTTEFQTLLLNRFFSITNNVGKLQLTNNVPDADYCVGWNPLECRESVLRKIDLYAKAFGNYELNFMPPTTSFVDISRANQRQVLITRNLPRNLKEFRMYGNQLFGVLDIAGIPTSVRMFSVWDNFFNGPISLTLIPRDLRHLNVVQNRIEQKVVYYGDLPENLQELNLVDMNNPKNKIEKVQAIDRKVSPREKKRFKCFPEGSFK